MRCTGTEYLIKTNTGSFGGGTLTPKVRESSSETAVTYGTTTLTSSGAIAITIPEGMELGATLSGSTSPSLGVKIIKIR